MNPLGWLLQSQTPEYLGPRVLVCALAPLRSKPADVLYFPLIHIHRQFDLGTAPCKRPTHSSARSCACPSPGGAGTAPVAAGADRGGAERSLTLITAPAGSGKTTLVASCIANCGLPVAWLSLDKNDNQAWRFLSYLIAALQGADHTRWGSEATQLMAGITASAARGGPGQFYQRPGWPPAGRWLWCWMTTSSSAARPSMTWWPFLLQHCPRAFHPVIASRSDPPLPLVRLRARGQTVELRAADLSFTEPEAAQFLNDLMGLRLDAGSVAALQERTEGWIAGLQMAASPRCAIAKRRIRVYRRLLRHESLHPGLPAGGGPCHPVAGNPAFS